MAFIHVVIPVYHAEAYLREAVASVLNQPCNDIDVILVDDGSPDRSPELCDELAAQDDRVRVIHQENGGVSKARNAGIEFFLSAEADGYIAFLDADDIWSPGVFTQELCDRLRMETDTDVFVFGSCTANGDLSRYSAPCRYEDHLLEGGSGCIWKLQRTFCANLYSTELLRKWNIRFAPGLKYSEDKIFMLQCAFLAKYVHFLPPMLHVYRENDTSAMRRFFSIDPIDYYIPIINGWVASDRFLNGCSERSGRTTHAGEILAGIYFLDMAQEHFERWHDPARLRVVFASHPDYHLFVDMDPSCVSPKQYADHNLLLEHPLRFRLRANFRGAVKFILRLALRWKPIRMRRHRRKYPLTQLPT